MPGGFIGHEPPRIDWVGRPEQTNMRLNNTGMTGADDLRDLWNQQTPFAIAEELRPLFLQRLKDSLAEWDMRDGKQDWTPAALAANANMFLDDFHADSTSQSRSPTPAIWRSRKARSTDKPIRPAAAARSMPTSSTYC